MCTAVLIGRDPETPLARPAYEDAIGQPRWTYLCDPLVMSQRQELPLSQHFPDTALQNLPYFAMKWS